MKGKNRYKYGNILKWDRIEAGMILVLWATGVIMSTIVTKDFFCAHDAADYWQRGESIWQEGHFSLLNMSGFRGYVYPLYLGICNRLGGKTAYIIINSLVNSLFMILIVPKLHDAEKKDIIRCVICYGLFNICFMGLSVYPLSDLFAIILCSTGILIEIKIERAQNIWKILGYSILMGGIVYCAYNVRTIYLFAGGALFLKLIIHLIWSKEKLIKDFAIVVGESVGALVAAIPQIYMNYHETGIISIKVPTDGLMLRQVLWGLKFQRYDTYIGQAAEHPEPQMYFVDSAGTRILSYTGVEGFPDWLAFFKFVFKHPFDIAAIYIRHITNALFPCWPNQYVEALDNDKVIAGLLSISLLFLFGIAVLNKFINRNFISRYWVLLIPVLFIIPGAVETRFFVALYIMIIGVLCYNVKWLEVWKYICNNKIKIVVLFFIYGGLVLAIWTNMLASDPSCGIYMQ